jgi:hypothetical protein
MSLCRQMASVFGNDDEFANVMKKAAKPAPSLVKTPSRGVAKAAARTAQPKMFRVTASPPRSATLSPEAGEEIPDDEEDLSVPSVGPQPPAAAYKPPKVRAPKVSKFAPRMPMTSAQQYAQLAQAEAAPEQASRSTDPDSPSVVEDEPDEPIPDAVDITAPEAPAFGAPPKQIKPKKAKGKEKEKPEVSQKRLKKKAGGGGAPVAGTTEEFTRPAAIQQSSLHMADSDPATATLMHISETDFKVGEGGRSVAVPYLATTKTPTLAQATPELGVLGSKAASRLAKQTTESTDTRLEQTRAAASAPTTEAAEAALAKAEAGMRPPSPPTASASNAPVHAALDTQRLSPERDLERAAVLHEQVGAASASEEGQSLGRDAGRMATPPTQLSPARPSPSPSKARATVTAARYQQRSSPTRRPTTAPTVYVRPGTAVQRIQVIRVLSPMASSEAPCTFPGTEHWMRVELVPSHLNIQLVKVRC